MTTHPLTPGTRITRHGRTRTVTAFHAEPIDTSSNNAATGIIELDGGDDILRVDLTGLRYTPDGTHWLYHDDT